MNNIQKLLHSPEIQEELHIKSAHIKMDVDKKRALGNAYLKLYFGLSCMNWTNKKNLGTAWQTAFTQVQNILNARDENNPATKFLRIVHDQHKKTWSRHIMTHPQRDAAFDGDPAKMRESAIRGIRSAMGEIALLSSQVKFTVDKSSAKQGAKQPIQVAVQNRSAATVPPSNVPEKNMESQPSKNAPAQMSTEQNVVSPDATQAEKSQREQLAKIIRAQMPMSLKVQKADQMLMATEQKEIIPQTHTGEPVVAQPGVNSKAAPQQPTGMNSGQVALRPVDKPRSLSGEETAKKDGVKIVNLWKMMRTQMFNQNNGRAA